MKFRAAFVLAATLLTPAYAAPAPSAPAVGVPGVMNPATGAFTPPPAPPTESGASTNISGAFTVVMSGPISPALPAGSVVYCSISMSIIGAQPFYNRSAAVRATVTNSSYSCNVQQRYATPISPTSPALNYNIYLWANDSAGVQIRVLSNFSETIPVPASTGANTSKWLWPGPL